MIPHVAQEPAAGTSSTAAQACPPSQISRGTAHGEGAVNGSMVGIMRFPTDPSNSGATAAFAVAVAESGTPSNCSLRLRSAG